MLYNLLYPLSDTYSIFNVFKYITFRAAYSFIISFLLMVLFGNLMINLLKKWKLSQKTKGFEPARHKKKEGTPTMGGLMIVISTVLSVVLWSDLSNPYILIVLFIFISYACIGFADDYVKTILGKPTGIRGRTKLIWQFIFASCAIFVLNSIQLNKFTYILFPFFKDLVINLGFIYFILAYFVIIGSSNAVNITDGLDGLATLPSIVSFIAFALISYIAGNVIYSSYLSVIYVKGAGELAIFCSALAGAGLGFLWFNTYPATIFMGDVGSLSIGGSLGAIAVIVKQELLLFLIGGIFVIETLSVILQVFYFKTTKGKRLFKMAPIHHHFELVGWSEPKIIVRFWIIAILLAIIGISTLKLR